MGKVEHKKGNKTVVSNKEIMALTREIKNLRMSKGKRNEYTRDSFDVMWRVKREKRIGKEVLGRETRICFDGR